MLSFSSLKRNSHAPTNLNDIVSFFFAFFVFSLLTCGCHCHGVKNGKTKECLGDHLLVLTSLYPILKEKRFVPLMRSIVLETLQLMKMNAPNIVMEL